jgi:hypothetical protein
MKDNKYLLFIEKLLNHSLPAAADLPAGEQRFVK